MVSEALFAVGTFEVVLCDKVPDCKGQDFGAGAFMAYPDGERRCSAAEGVELIRALLIGFEPVGNRDSPGVGFLPITSPSLSLVGGRKVRRADSQRWDEPWTESREEFRYGGGNMSWGQRNPSSGGWGRLVAEVAAHSRGFLGDPPWWASLGGDG